MKRSNTSNTERRRFLVYVTGDRIGDGLLKYPVLKTFRLAVPEAQLIWVTGRNPSIFKRRLAPLADGLIDEIHECCGLGETLFQPIPEGLRSKFDVVVCTESRLRAALQLRRLSTSLFICPALRFRLSARAPQTDFIAASSYERFRLLMELAAGKELVVEPRIEVAAPFVGEAARRLPGSHIYVGLSPGAGGASKRWPLRNFIGLGRLLAKRGIVPAFFLGPEELAFEAGIREALPSAVFPERMDGSAMEDSPMLTIALARRMAFSVANDSGGGHLIAAGGQPLLTLYGHTSANKFRSPYCDHYALSAEEKQYRSLEELTLPMVEAHLHEIGFLSPVTRALA
ncbi:MAG: glycosyltransferase family 9 protein [Gammaproteobacteria bacterium]|nr:glycosyltransferase family 9 protein [Gammaproteobacteria bacterium]